MYTQMVPMLQITKVVPFLLVFIGISCFEPSSQHIGDREVGDAVFDGSGLGKNAGLPGHMQPLGSHRPPEKQGIDVLKTVPDPVTFYDKYVDKGRPVLFRGAAKKMRAFQLWSDDYLRSKYGSILVDVEEGKKENRSQDVWTMPLSDYVDQYKTRDMYLVHSVPSQMQDDFGLLRCLLCGGFSDYLQDAVLWYSSGGTKSVLHFDSVDNINCVIDGEKELFMVDKKEKDHIDIDSPEGGFSNVDVDKVDMYRYPGLGKVSWYNVTMHPGDCLYIPYKWFHHVNSQGRNLAVNIWFVHKIRFDRADCENQDEMPEYASLSGYTMINGKEQIRVEILNIFADLDLDFIEADNIVYLATNLELPLQTAKLVFDILDADKDKRVSLEEIYNSNMEDLAGYFPDEENAHDEL